MDAGETVFGFKMKTFDWEVMSQTGSMCVSELSKSLILVIATKVCLTAVHYRHFVFGELNNAEALIHRSGTRQMVQPWRNSAAACPSWASSNFVGFYRSVCFVLPVPCSHLDLYVLFATAASDTLQCCHTVENCVISVPEGIGFIL